MAAALSQLQRETLAHVDEIHRKMSERDDYLERLEKAHRNLVNDMQTHGYQVPNLSIELLHNNLPSTSRYDRICQLTTSWTMIMNPNSPSQYYCSSSAPSPTPPSPNTYPPSTHTSSAPQQPPHTTNFFSNPTPSSANNIVTAPQTPTISSTTTSTPLNTTPFAIQFSTPPSQPHILPDPNSMFISTNELGQLASLGDTVQNSRVEPTRIGAGQTFDKTLSSIVGTEVWCSGGVTIGGAGHQPWPKQIGFGSKRGRIEHGSDRVWTDPDPRRNRGGRSTSWSRRLRVWRQRRRIIVEWSLTWGFRIAWMWLDPARKDGDGRCHSWSRRVGVWRQLTDLDLRKGDGSERLDLDRKDGGGSGVVFLKLKSLEESWSSPFDHGPKLSRIKHGSERIWQDLSRQITRGWCESWWWRFERRNSGKRRVDYQWSFIAGRLVWCHLNDRNCRLRNYCGLRFCDNRSLFLLISLSILFFSSQEERRNENSGHMDFDFEGRKVSAFVCGDLSSDIWQMQIQKVEDRVDLGTTGPFHNYHMVVINSCNDGPHELIIGKIKFGLVAHLWTSFLGWA